MRDIRDGADFWQLPERLYLQAAAGIVGGAAGVGVAALGEEGSVFW